eukprot:364208-Chlamydomonas_euryale.AAC.28
MAIGFWAVGLGSYWQGPEPCSGRPWTDQPSLPSTFTTFSPSHAQADVPLMPCYRRPLKLAQTQSKSSICSYPLWMPARNNDLTASWPHR